MAAPTPLPFEKFMDGFLETSPEAMEVRRQVVDAQNANAQQTDLWKSRLDINPSLSFEEQKFDTNLRPDNSNRTSQVQGTLTQQMPSGTELQVSAQKYIEVQNPLFSSLDRQYSAKVNQDLFKNAFGASQKAQKEKAEIDLKNNLLRARQSLVNTCDQAFQLYTDTYRQQEELNLLTAQLKDARKALGISRDLFKSKLITSIDKLSSESDFINRELDYKRAQQQFEYNRMQMAAFTKQNDFQLVSPDQYLQRFQASLSEPTLNEVIVKNEIQSQDLQVDKLASDRRTDVKLGLEVGERVGRLALGGPLIGYNEQFLRANLNIGFDLINNTEDSALRSAIANRNNWEVSQKSLQTNQKVRVSNLQQLVELLEEQITNHKKQSTLLEKKMNLAFQRMKRAKIDFETYLLHRNSYLSQKQKLFQIQVDYWRNKFNLIKEYAHNQPQFCKAKL